MAKKASVLFLLSFLLVSPLFCASSFSDCAPEGELNRFWLKESYWASNPYLYRTPVGIVYSTLFYKNVKELSMEDISLSSKEQLGSSLPVGSDSALSTPIRYSDESRLSLEAAKNEHKKANDALFGIVAIAEEIDSDIGAKVLVRAVCGITKTNSICSSAGAGLFLLYLISDYPAAYKNTLTNLANSFDKANYAVFYAAKRTDEKYIELKKMGAGDPAYSGEAKQAFLKAENAIAPGSTLCRRLDDHSTISEYFASEPILPSFAGYSEYLEGAFGSGGDSSISSLISLYYSLSDASNMMAQESQDSRKSAQSSIDELSKLAGRLGSMKLEKILEGSADSDSSGRIVIEPSFSGIYSGFLKGESMLSEARLKLSEANLLSSLRSEDNYLSNSIVLFQQSQKISDLTYQSLLTVEENAKNAVNSQKERAMEEISLAEDEISTIGNSAYSTSFAYSLLSQAKAEYVKGEGKSDVYGLGYEFFSKAAYLAGHARRAAKSEGDEYEKRVAYDELNMLKLLVAKAGSDLDNTEIYYWNEKIKSYQAMVDAYKYSPGDTKDSSKIIISLLSSISGSRQELYDYLNAKYKYMNGKHAELRAMIDEIRKTEPNFLEKADKLMAYFPGGEIDSRFAVGEITSKDNELDTFLINAKEKLPNHISLLLTKNARKVLELSGAFEIGAPAEYFLVVETNNPSQFSSSEYAKFNVPSQAKFSLEDIVALKSDVASSVNFDSGTLAIGLDGVEANTAYSFTFERTAVPLPVNDRSDACTFAYPERAEVVRIVEFSSDSDYEDVLVSESVGCNAESAELLYKGASSAMDARSDGSASFFSGEIRRVRVGGGTLKIIYPVFNPYRISTSEYFFKELGQGANEASFTLTVENAAISCEEAAILLQSPFSDIIDLEVIPLGEQKIASKKIAKSEGATSIVFTFRSLNEGKDAKFSVSYKFFDIGAALLESLAKAQEKVDSYGISEDSAALSRARELISQNRTKEALSVLSEIIGPESQAEPSFIDQHRYFSERERAGSLLFASQDTLEKLQGRNISSSSSDLYQEIFQLNSSIAEAHALASDGNYAKAFSTLSKSNAKHRESLAVLAEKSAKTLASEYVKARKAYADYPEIAQTLDGIAGEITSAQMLLSEGEVLDSFYISSQAFSDILALGNAATLSDAQALDGAKKIEADFYSMKAEAESALLEYSIQYSSLSGQSKKKLPVTPSSLQGDLDRASKSMESAFKASVPPQKSIALAASSYGQISGVMATVADALSSLKSSSLSSLELAKTALFQARQNSCQENEDDISALENEISRAEGFYSGGFYADSIKISESTVSAASAILADSSECAGGVDIRALGLAAASLIFLAAAGFYFLRKNGGPPGGTGKRALPKA